MKTIESIAAALGFALLQIGLVVVLIVAGHFALGAAIAVKEAGYVDQRYRAPIYADWPDRLAYWREFEQNWGEAFEPYVHWRRHPFSGEYINVDENGVRVTPKEPPLDDATSVFMFGGSTLWGTGATDAETIPALLQARLGRGYDVRNYGETAYVSTQELNYLLMLLARGDVPDIVIFYDGVNDGYAGAYSPAIPRDPHSIRARFSDLENWSGLRHLYEKSHYPFLVTRVQKWLGIEPTPLEWDARIAPEIAAKADATVDVFEANIRQVKALAREYGFAAYFFWQPHLLSGTRTYTDDYEDYQIRSASDVLTASQQAVFRAAGKRLSGREDEGIFFLGHAFDAVDEPLYIDWHHVGRRGNQIIADLVYRAVTDAEAREH